MGGEERHPLLCAASPCFCLPRLLAGFGSGPPAWEVGGGCGRTVLRRTLRLPVERLGRKEYSDGTARGEWEPSMFCILR